MTAVAVLLYLRPRNGRKHIGHTTTNVDKVEDSTIIL